MARYRTAFATLALALAAGTAQAESLAPNQGRSIDLGDVSGVAFYTVDRDGFRVVATLAQGEGAAPVRFVSTLAPGQSVVLSTPHEVGVLPTAVEIRRDGDRIVVEKAPQAY